MIIGNGNIAKSLISKDRDDIIFFASGVSDSSCSDKKEFQREVTLLNKQDYNTHLVYFSNLGIYYKKDAYTNHKKNMEELVKKNFKTYTIIRIEVCDWVKTPTTILNVFKEKIKNKQTIQIQNTTRYVLSLNEFLFWIDRIPIGVCNEMNILGKWMTIQEIVDNIKREYL
jgi:UDP-2-acetamido-2,6-beta-L-arabino-hexul-4-ose reductase